MGIILIQALTIFFAFFIAKHDVPAIDSFTDNGSTPKAQALFHLSNQLLKAAFVAVIFITSLTFGIGTHNFLLKALALALTCGAWIWLIFDPVVAVTRKNKQPWYYLSTSNGVDSKLLSIFGAKAGIYKTLILVAAIIIVNWIML